MCKSIWVSLVILLLADCSIANAQGSHAGTKQEQQACSRDASRLCRKQTQLNDDNAVQQCLLANRNKLSSACRKVFEGHGM